MIFQPRDDDTVPKRIDLMQLDVPEVLRARFRKFKIWHELWDPATGGQPRDSFHIDPHGGTCNGEHNIVVIFFRPAGAMQGHSTVSWRTSLFLGNKGASEFALALSLSLQLMHQLDTTGGYNLTEAMLHAI